MSELKQSRTVSPNAEANMGQSSTYADRDAERAYRRKVDLWSNLANAKTDGLDEDLHFQGNDYSLLILVFYIPFGLFDLPWNLLIKRYSGRIMLSSSKSILDNSPEEVANLSAMIL
ncbi:unnamed protein product [Aspergillus oryzae]|uniref:Unnamed protein product n=1 Tax=Aspergillus oryzae TaxID=5062 RepID=A0AAN4YW41_ASPOZ|nr:unnamed protein product [Aspergillus oryzae]GMF97062.1 unnamed protein product [Aspergillus oryzae]GMG14803.1 unnamed protein product [Aspergillus oryzae]GMG36060.1 unnamed protein product [Aspergillus oryzae]